MGINFLSNLFLANTMNLGLAIGLIIGGVIVALVGGFFVGMFINNKRTEKRLGDVQTRTKKMIDDATNECVALKKEAKLEAKEQELQLRNEFEKESRSCKNSNRDFCKERILSIRRKSR